MRYLVLLSMLLSFCSCQEENTVDFFEREHLEGIWTTEEWEIDDQGNISELTVQFSEVNQSGSYRAVPFNSWGYNTDDVVFRYLEPSRELNRTIEGEMLVRYNNPTRTVWTPVRIVYGEPRIWITLECNDCPNIRTSFVRQ